MSARPAIPRDVHRRLWALSMGHCFNPACVHDLFVNDTSIGEIAHIRPHSESGDSSLTNLLILCPNCHTTIDKNREEWPDDTLTAWHSLRQEEIQKRFAKRCASFRELEDLVQPLLRRNARIFESYGPTENNTSDPARRRLWLKFEPEVIVNNQRLHSLFDANMRLFHMENQPIIEHFKLHVAEFVSTRDNDFPDRVVLFPRDINAMFGLGSARDRNPPPSVSALQNLIRNLIDRGRSVSIELTPRQLLKYTIEDRIVEMDLSNRPRMQQLYFSRRYYQPQTTEVRLSDLVFILGWLEERGIDYSWDDIIRLTEVKVANLYNVTFCYKYTLSQVDIYDLCNKPNVIIVNLYGWNNSDVDLQTVMETSETGVHSLNQREFCKFMLRRSR